MITAILEWPTPPLPEVPVFKNEPCRPAYSAFIREAEPPFVITEKDERFLNRLNALTLSEEEEKCLRLIYETPRNGLEGMIQCGIDCKECPEYEAIDGCREDCIKVSGLLNDRSKIDASMFSFLKSFAIYYRETDPQMNFWIEKYKSTPKVVYTSIIGTQHLSLSAEEIVDCLERIMKKGR